MRDDVALVLVASVATVLAIVLVVTPDHRSDVPPGARPPRRAIRRQDAWRRAASGAVVAAVVLVCSGWVVPAAVAGVATAALVATRSRRHGRHDVVRTDALASWIENLRDVLLAGDQVIGAISSTVDTCPEVLRPAVRRLALGLGHVDPEVAFRRFADEIDDPLGDLVAAGLLIAVRRGARTVDVLSSLATQARHQADRRRIVEAERAPLRREVTMLSAVMGGLVVVLLVFGRTEYLAAYDSLEGQVVLGTALLLYAALLVRVHRLAIHPAPRRFLNGPTDAGTTGLQATVTGMRGERS